jgi:hypothetical protein
MKDRIKSVTTFTMAILAVQPFFLAWLILLHLADECAAPHSEGRGLCNEICVCLRARSLLVIAQPPRCRHQELCREGFG